VVHIVYGCNTSSKNATHSDPKRAQPAKPASRGRRVIKVVVSDCFAFRVGPSKHCAPFSCSALCPNSQLSQSPGTYTCDIYICIHICTSEAFNYLLTSSYSYSVLHTILMTNHLTGGPPVSSTHEEQSSQRGRNNLASRELRKETPENCGNTTTNTYRPGSNQDPYCPF